MEKVTGIGGLFFRARDAAALARWYQDHLGVTLTPTKIMTSWVGSRRQARRQARSR
jgi:glyoxylase I family protein